MIMEVHRSLAFFTCVCSAQNKMVSEEKKTKKQQHNSLVYFPRSFDQTYAWMRRYHAIPVNTTLEIESTCPDKHNRNSNLYSFLQTVISYHPFQISLPGQDTNSSISWFFVFFTEDLPREIGRKITQYNWVSDNPQSIHYCLQISVIQYETVLFNQALSSKIKMFVLGMYLSFWCM